MRIGYSDTGEYDEDRNFTYSAKGTYGTSGWMSRKEMAGVLELVADLHGYQGIVLGMLERKAVCVPEKTRLNSNLAVYGASGSMKTRSFCMNRILQGVSRGESLVICDPKSELYEKSSEYLRDKGYTVRVFNLVSPENSDSWNCLCEVEGQELMAQLFVDVIIKNTTGGGKGDHFWDSAEMNLLKALVLYVDKGYPPENRNMGQVYQLITLNSETALNSLFEVLPINHPAKAPYSLFKQASDSVRSGVIIGLGSRLQVFQSELIKKITAKDEIDLELPGQKSKQLGTWRISNYTPEYRETSGVGKRPVLTPDEVLRLPIDEALVIIRGKKTLKVDKMDYSKHPEYPLLRSCKASAHIPEWRRLEMEAAATPEPAVKPAPQKAAGKQTTKTTAKPAAKGTGKAPAPGAQQKAASPPASGPGKAAPAVPSGTPAGIISTDKDSIMS